MFTVCPKCALTLVVTAADLRIAQGYVRCGRCLNVFNALARLSEDRPAAAPAPADTTDAADTAGTTDAAAQSPPEEPARPLSPMPASPLQASGAGAEDTGEIEIELDAG